MSHEATPPHSASVNPEDVARFNRLGDLWWDKKGKMGILHEINPRVHQKPGKIALRVSVHQVVSKPPEKPSTTFFISFILLLTITVYLLIYFFVLTQKVTKKVKNG